ncbi:MAG TPA: ABC transporter ATP-binding protein [Geminicoccaceae bacterium]|jgi:simple sugar transport system ATP-binding protein|nr:ABC transporter ATP-binding protein [Geminicoccaceae bacterium]
MNQQEPALPPRLELRGISKRYPGGVLANDDVGFAVMPGEIHALLGENGAGKSTLVKIIYGVLQGDRGTIRWNGREVAIASPKDARRLGIGMVFQHFSLFEAMTVLENIALGVDEAGDLRALAARITGISRTYGLPLEPGRHVHALSVGERQRIEIVRCLLQNPKLLIMDEPTSVLTPQEVERLFATLRQLAAEDCSILYISHKLEEIKALCHRATILREGRVVAECDPARETARSMAELMIGRELAGLSRPKERTAGPPRLSVDGLTLVAEQPFGTDLKNVTFEVGGGEIFGIAGVAGNGQNELLAALAGERTVERAATIRIDGRAIGRLDAGARRDLGLACVPEERDGHGAVADMSLLENAVLSGYRRMGLIASGFIRGAAAARYAESVVERFRVVTSGIEAAASSLSGGNLQKFIVGREVLQTPGVLVASQPTWGVDAGAAAAIHQALSDLAANGAAVLVISQDLDELLTLTDRLAVINEGVLSRPMVTHDASLEEIGLLMGGLHGMAPELPEAQPNAAHVA